MVLEQRQRWAYFSDATTNDRDAREHEAFAAIQHCGKWSYCAHTHAGKKGVLAFFGSKAPAPRELSQNPTTCESGLIYFRPNPLPTQHELGKASPYPSTLVTTSRGRQLSIPLAVGAPRLVSFTGQELGDFVDEFPIVAGRVEAIIQNAKDMGEEIEIDDADLLRLVLLAIQQTYGVMPELLDDLGWITTRDIVPIILAVMGADPLANGDEQPTSDSLPAESKRTDSLLPANGTP